MPLGGSPSFRWVGKDIGHLKDVRYLAKVKIKNLPQSLCANKKNSDIEASLGKTEHLCLQY
jgi:hypothetical protein